MSFQFIPFLCFLLSLGACSSYEQSRQQAIKQQQYMIQGKMLYEAHCMNCHQIDGSGLGKLIPPMDSSFIQSKLSNVICGIKNGMEGKLTIQGVTYDGIMPANPRLTPLEIAELATFISNTWSHSDTLIPPSEAQQSLNGCK